jgi:hypothetical protein
VGEALKSLGIPSLLERGNQGKHDQNHEGKIFHDNPAYCKDGCLKLYIIYSTHSQNTKLPAADLKLNRTVPPEVS